LSICSVKELLALLSGLENSFMCIEFTKKGTLLKSTVKAIARSYSYLPKGAHLAPTRFCKFSRNSQAYEGNFTVKKG
jgi:hypothetical protein